MKANCHNPVSQIKGLLHSIAVMHVHVHIQHSRMELQQLQNSQHYVVRVAESACLALFGVVQPAAPVYCDTRVASQQHLRCVDGAAA